MKKILLTTLAAISLSLGYSQTEGSTTRVVAYGVEINTAQLTPITYTSQADFDLYVPARIAEIKTELAAENISEEYRISLVELLWRFENAIVIEQKN
jgi:hypothetical protein